MTDRECYEIITEIFPPETLKRLKIICGNPCISLEEIWEEFISQENNAVSKVPDRIKNILYQGTRFMKEIQMMRN